MATSLVSLYDAATIDQSQLEGAPIGTIERRYGLLRCDEMVSVSQVFNRTGDLAVADRLAFVYAGRSHTQAVVLEQDGWYYPAALDRTITTAQLREMRSLPGGPRLHSLVSERGITPVVAPLVCEQPQPA